MNKMKYNLPTLLALCQDTGVDCKWTSQSIDCRKSRSGRDKGPIFAGNIRDRPTKKLARPSRPGKHPAPKPGSQYRKTAPKKNISNHYFPAHDAGFVQFLKRHTSPKHQRVTAGGRIVPMDPPKAPLLGGKSPAMMAAINGIESIAGHIFIDGQLMAANNGRAAGLQENVRLIQASTGNSTGELWSPPIFASGITQKIDSGSQETVFQDVALEPPFIPYIHDPIEGLHDEYVPLWEFPEWHEIDTPAPDDRWGRWHSIASEINHDEAAIKNMWMHVKHLDNFPTLDFYSRFAHCVLFWGLDTVKQAEHWLKNKLLYHERYLVEVNEVIAMDPGNEPNITLYALRVYNTKERAKLLAAIEILEAFTEQRLQAPVGPIMSGGSDGDMPTIIIEPTGTNRGIDIIDPETGRPIVIQISEGRGGEAEGSTKSLTFDGADDGIGNNLMTNNVWYYGNAASRPIIEDAENAQIVQDTPEDVTPPSEEYGDISWVHQETWTEHLPSQDGHCLSETVPRNFGGSPSRYRLSLSSFSQCDQPRTTLEGASTTGTAGSPIPALSAVISVDENEDGNHVEAEVQQNVQPIEINGISEENDLNSQGPIFNPREPLVSSDVFNMFVVNIDDVREMNGSNNTSEESFEESCRQITGPRTSTEEHRSIRMFTRTGLRNGTLSSDSDESVPILSHPYPPHSWDESAHPAIPKSDLSIRSGSNGDMLSSTGSRMISTTLTARRCRQSARARADAIMRHAQTSPSRLIFNLRDKVPIYAAFGFDAPDSVTTSEANSQVVAWLKNTQERHTARAVVNTSRINAYADRRQ